MYSDPVLGLSNYTTLWYWFRAAYPNEDALASYYQETIYSYFTSKGVKLTRT